MLFLRTAVCALQCRTYCGRSFNVNLPKEFAVLHATPTADSEVTVQFETVLKQK